jgi:filamentous hemagglutinin
VPNSRSSCLALILIAVLLAPGSRPYCAWAAELFHPDGYNARGGEDAKAQERRKEEAVTKARETWRSQDLTNRPRQEFHDGRELEAKIEAQQRNAEKLSIELMANRNEKGNYGIGSGTHADAARLGREWVGQDATVASDGKTLVSADRLRQYRPPSFKPSLGREQANFERRDNETSSWISNGQGSSRCPR